MWGAQAAADKIRGKPQTGSSLCRCGQYVDEQSIIEQLRGIRCRPAQARILKVCPARMLGVCSGTCCQDAGADETTAGGPSYPFSCRIAHRRSNMKADVLSCRHAAIQMRLKGVYGLLCGRWHLYLNLMKTDGHLRNKAFVSHLIIEAV